MTGWAVAFGLVVGWLLFAFFYRLTSKQRRAAQARGVDPLIEVDARGFWIAGAMFLIVAVAHAILAVATGNDWPIGVCAASLTFAGVAFLIAKSRRETKPPDA